MGLTCLITLLHFSTHTSQCTSIASWFVAGDALLGLGLLLHYYCFDCFDFPLVCSTFASTCFVLFVDAFPSLFICIYTTYIHIYEFIYTYMRFSSSFQWVLLGITNWIWAVQLCGHSLTGGSHETGYCQWAYLLQVLSFDLLKGSLHRFTICGWKRDGILTRQFIAHTTFTPLFFS
jgi:hypothetical protein